jgi:hypothetical protein
VKDFAVVIAGTWAYLKFIKGRVYHTRLEPSVDGKVFQHDLHEYVSVVARLNNVGASKVDLRQEGTALEVSCADLYPESFDHKFVRWTRIATAPVFKRHRWIEASETIEEAALFRLPSETSAVKIEFRLVADIHQWFRKWAHLKQGWRKPLSNENDRDRKRNQWYANVIIDIHSGRTDNEGGKEPNVTQKEPNKLEHTSDESSVTKQDQEDRRETERVERDKLEYTREDERTSDPNQQD